MWRLWTQLGHERSRCNTLEIGLLDWGRAGNITFSGESLANMDEGIRETFQDFVNKRQHGIWGINLAIKPYSNVYNIVLNRMFNTSYQCQTTVWKGVVGGQCPCIDITWLRLHFFGPSNLRVLHWTKCPLSTLFFLLLFLSLRLGYFSPKRGSPGVLKFCMGF